MNVDNYKRLNLKQFNQFFEFWRNFEPWRPKEFKTQLNLIIDITQNLFEGLHLIRTIGQARNQVLTKMFEMVTLLNAFHFSSIIKKNSEYNIANNKIIYLPHSRNCGYFVHSSIFFLFSTVQISKMATNKDKNPQQFHEIWLNDGLVHNKVVKGLGTIY